MLRNIWDFLSLFPASDDAGGGASDDVKDPASDEANTKTGSTISSDEASDDEKWRDRYKSADSELRKVQAEIAKMKKERKERETKELEDQEKWKELYEAEKTKNDELTGKTADLEKFKDTVLKQKQTDLEKLSENLSDEQKDLLTGDIDADLKLARHFGAVNTAPQGPGRTPAAGGQIKENVEKTRKEAREKRDNASFYDTMPVIGHERK